ncbi:7730_t:CDS:2, partial [Gigaspora margarita]
SNFNKNTLLPENPTSISNLISFDKNIPIYYPNVSNVPVVDLLTGNIPNIKAKSSSNANRDQKKNQFLMIDKLIKWLSKPQAYYFLDLDIEVPWPVPFPENKEHREYAKDMFKVDGAEYAFSTWFIDTEEHKLEAEMTKEQAQEILNAIDNSFKIIDKYEPIHESKKAGRKYIRGGPNVILTKKTKPGFWIGIDEKFLVREVRAQSEVERLDSNAVVYGLYQIRKPDVNRLMPIKDGTLNCVAERVIEHFDQAKRGYGLTKIRRQKINDWEKKMRIPGARVHDIAELKKILKRPITLLDITHGIIFNSKKYRSGKYEEIEIVVHNGHAFSRNQHFPRDQMLEYYKGDTWEAINNALQGPQAIWLMGVGDETQRISQFVLENGRTFRTWKKHKEIIEACKQLVNDAINWQYQENIINEKKRSILLESLKVVDLVEQVFGANHARSRLANEINEWYPISEKINDDIKQACVEHEHGQGECAPWFNQFGHPTYHLVQVVVNGKLPKDDITGFAQVKSFKFAPNIHSVIPVWYGKHFAYREDLIVGEVIISLTKQTKVWLPNNRDISCAIIGKFTQGSKIDEKCLTHRLVTDEVELDFLIKDCTDAGTFAASMLAYAHINLLEMLQRFEPNEVVRIATDSIYVQKEALYKIENVPAFFKQEKAKDPDLCPHTYPLCAMCTDLEEFFISKLEYAKWIKEFLKTKMPLVKDDCKRHKPYICRFCFGEWFYRPDSYALLHQLEEQEIWEIQPNQWHDKGKKIYGPNADIIYWPKNRHWELIKDITENINMVVFTYTNMLAKDFQNDREWTSKCMGEKKFPRVVIWDEPPPFFGEMPHDWLKEQADYYEE